MSLVKGGQGRSDESIEADGDNLCLALFLAILMLVFCYGCQAEDDLVPQAQAWIAAHSRPSDESAWAKAFDRSAAQAEADGTDHSAESYARRRIVDFMSTRRDAKKWTDRDRLEMCRLYLLCRERGYSFPESVSDVLTVENFNKYFGEGTVRHE